MIPRISKRSVLTLATVSQIGRNIGAAKTNRFERVLSLNGDKLVLEAAFPAPHYRRFIDLAEPRSEREEVDFEGAISHKMEHHVYENGKISKSE